MSSGFRRISDGSNRFELPIPNTASANAGIALGFPDVALVPLGIPDAKIITQKSARWEMGLRYNGSMGAGVHVRIGWQVDDGYPYGYNQGTYGGKGDFQFYNAVWGTVTPHPQVFDNHPYMFRVDYGINVHLKPTGCAIYGLMEQDASFGYSTVATSTFDNKCRIQVSLYPTKLICRIFTWSNPKQLLKMVKKVFHAPIVVERALPKIGLPYTADNASSTGSVDYNNMQYFINVSESGGSELRHIQRDDTLGRKNPSSQQKTIRTFGAYR